jgi:hypothetical protein
MGASKLQATGDPITGRICPVIQDAYRTFDIACVGDHLLDEDVASVDLGAAARELESDAAPDPPRRACDDHFPRGELDQHGALRELLMRRLPQRGDHNGGDDRGGDEVIGVRRRGAHAVNEPDRDEGRETAEDRDRERIARGSSRVERLLVGKISAIAAGPGPENIEIRSAKKAWTAMSVP